jgi:ribosomal protein S18 acetylase RimI-like enzyme
MGAGAFGPSPARPLPGRLVRRPERAEDEPFRLRLFRESRAPGEDFAFLAPALRERLLRQQFAAQSAGYRAQYPDALFDIVERDGVPIGRIVVARGPDAILLVDIALAAGSRGRGHGAALVMEVCETARAARLPVRLRVRVGNEAAFGLYRRLGFVAVAVSEIDIAMEWRPSQPLIADGAAAAPEAAG